MKNLTINVGDYVRTEYGIAKIKTFETKNKEVINLDKDIMICNMDCYRNCCTINQVIKSSPNITDLIEVGDYVNREKVTQVTNGYIEVCYGRDSTDFIKIENIKSIVTKECFESMEYKIEN